MKQSNSEKLRALADWFDAQDYIVGRDPDDNEVQRDLRAMATEFEQLQQHGVVCSIIFCAVGVFKAVARGV